MKSILLYFQYKLWVSFDHSDDDDEEEQNIIEYSKRLDNLTVYLEIIQKYIQ